LPRLSLNLSIRAIQLLIVGLALIFFAVLSRAFPFFPSSLQVLRAGGELFVAGDVYAHILITLYETAAGFVIAIVLGLVIGVLLGVNRTSGEIFEPIILSFYAIPKIIFLPLLLVIFGVGISSKIANAALHAVFPIILNTLVGIREVNRIHIKAARSMNATRAQMFRKVYFPSMVLPVFAGMRIGVGFGFLGSLLAELFEAKTGLGFLVASFYNTGQVAKMLAIILFVFILTMAANAGMMGMENRLSTWRKATWRS
jgi:ABC-type nitrate/sulfonate/bicarbonate transport system permease component